MNSTLVILVVGLTPKLVGSQTPNIAKLAGQNGLRPMIVGAPAVTCSVQSTLLTGSPPSEHGAVANGWYFREMSEVLFWRQSNHLIGGEKIWEAAKKRDPDFTCAKMFWWYNMYASADFSATPRPQYPADGRKIPDHYAYPAALHDELDERLGQFPLFKFWGPLADITSSQWISRATQHVIASRSPTLTLCYLPHLDYNLQRLGPDPSHRELQQDLEDIDEICGELIAFAECRGMRTIIVSEYGITAVSDAVHINRALREAGLLDVRPEEYGREILDAGASRAFAVADHQIAHVYVRDRELVEPVRQLIVELDGVEQVLGSEEKRAYSLDHSRSGELVAIANADRWFSYYYWLDEQHAPDFARTVDIHRKPGYDPVDLFFDPELKLPKLASRLKLAKRKLGFRQLLDVISPSATSLVKGSHGRPTDRLEDGPLVISSEPDLMPPKELRDTQFKEFVLNHIFERS